MRTTFDPPPESDAEKPPPSWPQAVGPADGSTAAAWRAFANLLVQSGRLDRIDEAIEAYGQALDLDPGDGWTHFRLGVALRKRYDSPHRQPGDFQAAVDAWKGALDIDPNQYIWRRRIQQYGPRLDKPYPFYDWVPQAREEIAARGETPVGLTVRARAARSSPSRRASLRATKGPMWSPMRKGGSTATKAS